MADTGWSGKGSGLLPVTAGRFGAMCGSVSPGSGGGRDHGSPRLAARIEQVDTVEEAVLRASRLARSGDTVLLSPACASLDMFNSYVERGERFQYAVQALEVAS